MRKKVYNLEDSTYFFARECRLFMRSLPKTLSNIEDAEQLIKASGPDGAKYIQANDKFSDKDFLLRMKIPRNEAKEAQYWRKLLQDLNRKVGLEAEEFLKRVLN